MTIRHDRRKFSAVVLLLCIIIVPLLVTAIASANESAPTAGIEVLYGEDLSYDSDDLSSGLDHIVVAVHNKGTTAATLNARVLTDLVNTSGNPVELSSMDIKDLLPGETRLLVFPLNPQAMKEINRQPGQHKGFIVLTGLNNTTTYTAFSLAVPSASLAPDGEVSFAILGIDSAKPLKIDYDALVKENELIVVGVENNGKQAVNLTGNIVLMNLVDTDGKPFPLHFLLENESRQVNPVQLDPGQVGFLSFNLTQPADAEGKSPKIGVYTGYVVVTAREGGSSQHAALTLAVPSEDVTNQGTWGAAVLAKVQGVSRMISERFPGFKQELEINPLFLIVGMVLILGYLFRRGFARHNRRYPGPVTLNKITDATGASLNVDGLGAYMKDWLENVGLRQGNAKPYEEIVTAMETLLTEVPAAQGLNVKNILDALIHLIDPQTGHKVSSTLWKRTGTTYYEMICEIIESPTENVESIDCAQGDTPEEAIERGAAMVYHHVMQQKYVAERIAPWARFSLPESIELYQQGRRLENEEKRDQALEKYWQAAKKDPNNIYIRLAIIRCQEGSQFPDTLLSYLKLVEQWPVLLETRYRLAANLTFVENLVDECQKPEKSDQRQELNTFLQRSIEERKGCVFGSLIKEGEKRTLVDSLHKLTGSGPIGYNDQMDLKKCFLKLAKYQYEYLEKQSSRWTCLGKRMNLIYTNPDERKYYRYWKYRDEVKKFSKVVKLAEYCTNLRILGCSPNSDSSEVRSIKSEVETIVLPTDTAPWEVHYNAACFYALAIPLDNANHTKYAKTAVAHLKQVLRDREFTTTTWLFDERNGDPDLKNLREHDEFQHWGSIVKPTKEVKREEVSQAELDALVWACAHGYF